MHATNRKECTLLARAFAQPQKTSSRQRVSPAYARHAVQAVRRSALEAPSGLPGHVRLPFGQFHLRQERNGCPAGTGCMAGRCGTSVSNTSVAGSPAYAQGAMHGGSCLGGAVPA